MNKSSGSILLPFILVTSTLALTGCQTKTIEKLQSQTIDVIVVDNESNDILQRVTCSFSDNHGNTYALNKNPGSVTFTENSNKLYLSCQAPDYYQTQLAISNKLYNWSYSDLTLLPGYIIDTSAFPPAIYPSKLIVFMSHQPLPSMTNADKQFDETQKKEVFFQGTMTTNK